MHLVMTNRAELMHMSPTQLTNQRTAWSSNPEKTTLLMHASSADDMYSLGCIANHIYFREQLYPVDELFVDTGLLYS